MKKCLSDSYIVLDWTKFVEMAVSLLVIRLPVMIAKTILVSKQNLVNTYNVYLNQSHIESFGPVTNMKRKWPCAPCKKYLKTFLTELIFITCNIRWSLLIVSFNKKKYWSICFKPRNCEIRNREVKIMGRSQSQKIVYIILLWTWTFVLSMIKFSWPSFFKTGQNWKKISLIKERKNWGIYDNKKTVHEHV